jgi:hypothetical protein
MREVVLKLTTQKDVIKHQTDAKTFGELKRELPNIKWSGMRVVERGSKSTLQMKDAVLPKGDFLLFLVPERVKSGTKKEGGISELNKPIDDCSYNELRSHISWLNREENAGLDISGGTTELRKNLKKYYKKAEKKAKKEKKNDKVDAKEEVAKTMDNAPSSEKGSIMTDIAISIEDSRNKINTAIDSIIEHAAIIEQGGGAVEIIPPLTYNLEDLEKEVEAIRKALQTPAYTKVE